MLLYVRMVSRDRILGIKSNGETYVIAENILNNSEFAGKFSPSEKYYLIYIAQQ